MLVIVLIDGMLPVWHKGERHRLRADRSAADLLTAVEEVTWNEVAVFRHLMRVRSGGRRMPGGPVIGGMIRIGFSELTRGPNEIVYGGIGRPWSPRGRLVAIRSPESFVDFHRPGYAKMVLNFHADGGELSTETRVFLTDARARRAFAAYWLLVRPFSGWIRRDLLTGIAKRA